MSKLQEAFKSLPAVDKLLCSKEAKGFISTHGKETVTFAIRKTIDFYRQHIKDHGNPPSEDDIFVKISEILKLLTTRSLKKVYNATGITIHTNLGRSPFSTTLLQETYSLLSGYNNLEFNLKTGERGNRNDHAVDLLRFHTGAEDILVVNNAAAAVMLCLRTFARNREVIVSRGELIEIGGSFRIPDIMAASDCKMVEVGTTNKTKPDDYRRAASKKTALLFKAHKSNYIIKGFTQESTLNELVEIGKDLKIPVVYDQGSGLLRNINHPAFINEPNIRTSLETGVDLVCFSGDKLLGGPQAGIIAGKKIYIDKLKKEPMLRALRVCKTTLALLETACSYYLNDDLLFNNNIVFKLSSQTIADIDKKAAKLAKLLNLKGIACEVIESKTQVGGGSLPDCDIPSRAVILRPVKQSNKTRSEFAEKIYNALLLHQTPVLGILTKGNIMFDALTIDEHEIEIIANAIVEVHKKICISYKP